VCYFLVTFYILYLRFINLEMREPADSAAYMQVAWSALHWPPFTISMQENFISYFPYNFLGDQLMWTLALFSPLCLLPYPGIMFLAAQSSIISVGALLLYRIAAEKLEDRLLAILVTVCFLLNPATLLSFWHFGFRAETLFIPLTFLIFYLVGKERLFWACIVLTLFLLTKHNSILVGVPMGFYFIFWEKKQWRFGVFCIMASILYYIVGLKMVMAHLQENPVAHFKHFAQFGSTPWEAMVNIITNPAVVWESISITTIDYMIQSLFPAGFLSLFSAIFWLASSELLINALLPHYHAVYCGWHWTFFIPFSFLGMIYTTSWALKTKWSQKARSIFIALILIQLAFSQNISASKVFGDINAFSFRSSNTNTFDIISKIHSIDPEASIMVSSALLWLAFDREHIYNSRVRFHDEVDYIAILLPIETLGHKIFDKFIIDEYALEDKIGYSKFHNYVLISKSSNLAIYKHR